MKIGDGVKNVNELEFIGEKAAAPDWNASEGEPGYIEGRTHWEEKGTLVPSTELTVNEEGLFMTEVPDIVQLVVGNSYTVSWNGTVYNCIAKEMEGRAILGNIGPLQEGLPNTGEPFLITAELTDNNTTGIMAADFTGASTITLEISTAIVHKIDEKFIPIPKTHWVTEEDIILFPETTIECTESITYLTLPDFPKITIGETYPITWDGTTYDCVALETENESTTYVLGNGKWFIGVEKDNGMPFAIAGVTLNENGWTHILQVEQTGTHIISMVDKAGTVHKIDKKFIPELEEINSNLLNGSAEGSLRQINSPEHENYPIGSNAVAMGIGTHAIGNCSHAEGQDTYAIGFASHAEGSGSDIFLNLTGDANSTTYTYSNIISANYSLVDCYLELNNKIAKILEHDILTRTIILDQTVSNSAIEDAFAYCKVGAMGAYSHTEGYNAITFGQFSHAEGNYTVAGGRASHAEGSNTDASGDCSHTEGLQTNARGYCSHAGGAYTKATSAYQTVIGLSNKINSEQPFVEIVTSKPGKLSDLGTYQIITAPPTFDSIAGKYIYTEELIEKTYSELVVGDLFNPQIDYYSEVSAIEENTIYYNIHQIYPQIKLKGKYAFIIGNGEKEFHTNGSTSITPSNAHTVDWNGLGWYAGGLKVGGTGQDDENAVSVLTENDLAVITESEIDAICGQII